MLTHEKEIISRNIEKCFSTFFLKWKETEKLLILVFRRFKTCKTCVISLKSEAFSHIFFFYFFDRNEMKEVWVRFFPSFLNLNRHSKTWAFYQFTHRTKHAFFSIFRCVCDLHNAAHFFASSSSSSERETLKIQFYMYQHQRLHFCKFLHRKSVFK